MECIFNIPCFYLQNFPNGTEPLKKKGENFDWSLDRLNQILTHIDVVKDDSRRNLVQEVVKAFETKVLSRKNDFRKGKRPADMCGMFYKYM